MSVIPACPTVPTTPGCGGGTARARSERPQALEFDVDLAAELERVQTLIQRLKLLVLGRGQSVRGAEALIGGLGPVVDPMDPSAPAGLGDELLHRLEEVPCSRASR